MSWCPRLTRFALAHKVHAEHAQNSCDMTSRMMVNVKMKKLLMLAGMTASSAVSVVPIIRS
jgi:hypothetical protein